MAIIEISESKAIKIEGIKINGKKLISLRQMYKKKTDKKWQHGRSGMTIELDSAKEVRKQIRRIAEAEDSKFKEVDMSKGKDE